MSFDVDDALRRLKPQRRRRRFQVRDAAGLPLAGGAAPDGPVLLDSCVYIHAGTSRLPPAAQALLIRRPIFHCAVCIGELAHGLGALRPDDPRSAGRGRFIRDALARIPDHRVLTPDDAIWGMAGMLSGMLARTQDCNEPQRRKLLNDCLILLTARKHGQILLTANIADFDLISQIVGDARLVYYRA